MVLTPGIRGLLVLAVAPGSTFARLMEECNLLNLRLVQSRMGRLAQTRSDDR
jgi:hypothetical protein